MPFDFHNLKTITCYDTVTIRIPERWDVYPEDNAIGSWCCHKEGEESGTLWITGNQFDLPFNSVDLPGEELDRFVAGIYSTRGGMKTEAAEEKLERLGRDYLWYRMEDVEERGDPIRCHHYNIFQPYGRELYHTHFNFVLLGSILDDPEIKELTEIMDREIRAARIEPFSKPDKPTDTWGFEPTNLVNFDGRMRVELPGNIRGEAVGDNAWYLYFGENDEIEARLMVFVASDRLTYPDGGDVSVEDDEIVAEMKRRMSLEYPIGEVERLENGILSHEIMDEDPEPPEPGDPVDWRSGPIRCHFWRLGRIDGSYCHIGQFMLNLPRERSETPQLKKLVEMIGRSIPETEFLDQG